jgi:hypothetical protein
MAKNHDDFCMPILRGIVGLEAFTLAGSEFLCNLAETGSRAAAVGSGMLCLTLGLLALRALGTPMRPAR